MTSLTHLPSLHLPTLRRAARPARRPLRRRLATALTRLYADRPVTALASPGYAGEPPVQRYAELGTLAGPDRAADLRRP